ncbi:MAG: GyrI-like domain-containing protein [Variibacter sp.]
MGCRPTTASAFLAVLLYAGAFQPAAAQTTQPPPAAQAPAPPPGVPAPPPTDTSPPAATPAPAPAPAPVPGEAAPPAASADPFGEEVTLTARPIIFMRGNANWDTAFETLVDSFKTIYTYLEKQGIKPDGAPMTIYTATDDTGFQYQAAVPVAAEPANPPQGDIAVGKSPSGQVLKFVHRGSYDSMDTTYEAITNYLDSKSLEAEDLFFEEYVTDPLKTPEDKLVINVFVPVKKGI